MNREDIIRRARQIRNEIEQTFIDVAHWNEYVRKPQEPPIDPDPDGQLRRIADGLSAMLAREDARTIPDIGLPDRKTGGAS